MNWKPSRRFFLVGLGSLAGFLVIYGLLRWKFGPFLPEPIDKNLPDFVMVAAVGVMLWNRKILKDEAKAEAERKRLEDEGGESSGEAGPDARA